VISGLYKDSSKFYPQSLTLLANILKSIDEKHSTQTQVAFELGMSKPLISYYIRKAIRIGYIKELFRDKIRVLELTQEGKIFLDQLPICRAENIRFKARVYKLPSKPLDWNKVAMNNWSQYNSIVDDIKVHLNNGKTPSIEFIPSPINGSNPWELFGILYNDCNEVARKLEQTLDMEIGRLEVEHHPEWVVYDPVASIINKQNGQITVDQLGKINASKTLCRGELEYFDPRFAAKYLTMPRRISNIEKLLEDLVKKGNEAPKAKTNNNDVNEREKI
jgi:predicted transcriptional regulator